MTLSLKFSGYNHYKEINSTPDTRSNPLKGDPMQGLTTLTRTFLNSWSLIYCVSDLAKTFGKSLKKLFKLQSLSFASLLPALFETPGYASSFTSAKSIL